MESELGRGTRFVIELAAGASHAAEAARAAAVPVPPVSPKSVLVIDDEPDVAAVVAEALARDGHAADVAPNGAVALTMLRARAYDLVVSDTKMPVLDGEAFYAELARDFPHLSRRLVFLTGDVLSAEKREFLDRTGAPFLIKPFDVGGVRQLVRRTLAAEGGRT